MWVRPRVDEGIESPGERDTLVNLARLDHITILHRPKTESDNMGGQVAVRDDQGNPVILCWEVVALSASGAAGSYEVLAAVPTQEQARDVLDQLLAALRRGESGLDLDPPPPTAR